MNWVACLRSKFLYRPLENLGQSRAKPDKIIDAPTSFSPRKQIPTNRSYVLLPSSSHRTLFPRTKSVMNAIASYPSGSFLSGAEIPCNRMGTGPTRIVSPSRTFSTMPVTDVGSSAWREMLVNTITKIEITPPNNRQRRCLRFEFKLIKQLQKMKYVLEISLLTLTFKRLPIEVSRINHLCVWAVASKARKPDN